MDGKKKSLHPTEIPRRVGRLVEEKTSRISPTDTLKCLLAALIAFLLGSCPLPFTTYPLGLAFLCASSERTLYIAVGLLASSFTQRYPWPLTFFVTLGTLLIRILARVFIDLPARIGGDGRRGEVWEHLRGRMFCERLYLRMAGACVSVFAMSLFAIIRGGFRYYDLFGSLFSMVVAPVAVFLFAGLFEGEYESLFRPKIASILSAISRMVLAVAISYALSDTVFSGIPLSLVFSFVATLVICRRHGFWAALGAGVLSGAVLGLSYAPVLGVSALVAYCILDLSPILAASVACIAGTVCGVLLMGSDTVSRVFLPLLSGTAIYCTVSKLTAERQKPSPRPVPPSPSSDDTALHIAEALGELSSVFSAMSERQKKPTIADLRLLCDSCFDRLCPTCTAREACWEQRYHAMTDTLDALAATLARDGFVTEDTLPHAISDHCLGVRLLTEELNRRAAALAESTISSEKAEIFSLDYTAAATLLQEASQARERALAEDSKLSAAAHARLSELGYTAAVSVTGDRRRILRLHDLTPAPEASGLTYLTSQLEKACALRLSPLSDNGHGVLTASQKNTVDARYGSSFSARETVCGDVVSIFRDDERGYLCALLNDGMGTGKEAALTAQLGSLFLRKLLPAGVSTETALRMLNQFLRLGRNRGSTESCTTVDLLMLDLIGGRAIFLKSGAAPTYVKRGKNIFFLDSKTAPVGILKELDAKQIEFDVKAGDIIVMVSDGITDTADDNQCLWLLDYLDATLEEDPAAIARHIVSSASERGSHDDISAIALVVDKAMDHTEAGD